ncbi:MAG: M1 family metallopeptidase, partial [Chitinophagaceae bacterium]|nr:M1 family metallopeptidase [Chitinophagaceae bacterium]
GTVQIEYLNQSPDTLRFLWIHLWPNAYKNDQTAFSEQYLLEGKTDFYFSSSLRKGYINQVDFKADGLPARLEDHPAYIDVARLVLPKPLLPGAKLMLHTPFHVQLPEMVSRSGYKGPFYAVAQWFPKVAVYDRQGWHPMPYLSAGEYYSDFGNYEVSITLPENYAVAATGILESATEKEWLKTRTAPIPSAAPPKKKELFPTEKQDKYPAPPSSRQLKTVRYRAENVVDFAWAADKRFNVKFDTAQLGNKVVELWNFLLPSDLKRWKNSMQFTRRALHFYSEAIGNYPYPQVTVVASPASEADGMEYPMLTLLNEISGNEKLLDQIIAHEIGHNWLQAVIATNEREHAWMDEGMNTFLEKKYTSRYYPPVSKTVGARGSQKIPEDLSKPLLDYLTSTRQDAPIESSPDTVHPFAFYPVVYEKASQWMNMLESRLGQAGMQQLMQQYYQQWQFRHPGPQDFLHLAESIAGLPLTAETSLLFKTGPLQTPARRRTSATALFSLADTDRRQYIGIAPALGYNNHDKLSLGLVLHNYNIPASRFQFVLTPMLGTGSLQPVGYGRLGYHWYPERGKLYKAELYSGMARFSTNTGTNQLGESFPVGFSKVTPGLMLEWKKPSPLSRLQRQLDIRTFIISEQQLQFKTPPPPDDTTFYAERAGAITTIIPQATFTWRNDRTLYPWWIQAGVQQVKDIMRLTFTGNYFLNYGQSGKGISARLFAGKIFYLTEKTTEVRSNNSRYHFTMYGPNGQQDYTYSNAFAERNQSTQLAGRQIMIRDGGFKYRSDYSSVIPGLSNTGADFFDNWMVTLNTYFDLPDKINPLTILPFKTRLQVFADVGTSASPWRSGSNQPRFLYSIGLHLPVFKAIHLYYPLIQSEAFREPNSVNDPFREGGPKWWQEKLTFSIHFEDLKPKPGGFQIF